MYMPQPMCAYGSQKLIQNYILRNDGKGLLLNISGWRIRIFFEKNNFYHSSTTTLFLASVGGKITDYSFITHV
jgi:hypothetical protein